MNLPIRDALDKTSAAVMLNRLRLNSKILPLFYINGRFVDRTSDEIKDIVGGNPGDISAALSKLVRGCTLKADAVRKIGHIYSVTTQGQDVVLAAKRGAL